MKWSALTTPPPPRPRAPKHPLFTTDFFSTKSFGPGQIVGAGILVFGIVGLAKLFIWRGHAEAEAEGAYRLAQSPGRPRRSEDDPKLAQTDNARGQYGRKP
jgi:hypothetical protein